MQKDARSCIEKRARGVDAYIDDPGRVIWSSDKTGLATLPLDGFQAPLRDVKARIATIIELAANVVAIIRREASI
jgi:hypothetical protein